MNILPKKRWHVRTKDNIARVRRDEAEAKEQEAKQKQKLELAESEARINFLRRQGGIPEKSSTKAEDKPSDNDTPHQKPNHVDLFSDYKTHIKGTNKELEKEKKEEREKYEKQIGYLTYLGQDTNEALKLRSWYEVAPKRRKYADEPLEADSKNKSTHDPLTLIKALLPEEKYVPKKIAKEEKLLPPKSELPSVVSKRIEKESSKSRKLKKHKKEKHKKEKKSKKEKSRKRKKESKRDSVKKQKMKKDLLEKLRKERLQREAQEQARQEALLNPKSSIPKSEPADKIQSKRVVQKYNSQFNPELAKQNMI